VSAFRIAAAISLALLTVTAAAAPQPTVPPAAHAGEAPPAARDPAPAAEQPDGEHWAATVMVRCGNSAGTAFHLGSGRYATASHVTRFGECSIDGVPVRTVYEDHQLDVAEIEGPVLAAKLEADCSPLKKGGEYLALGFTGGRFRIQLPMIHSPFGRHPENNSAQFVGSDTQPGMSGGPSIGTTMKAAAITIQRWPNRARPLADTHFCRRA